MWPFVAVEFIGLMSSLEDFAEPQEGVWCTFLRNELQFPIHIRQTWEVSAFDDPVERHLFRRFLIDFSSGIEPAA